MMALNEKPKCLWRKQLNGEFLYKGEVKKGTNIQDGIGICLFNNGEICIGYFKDNLQHGKGRYASKIIITTRYIYYCNTI
jgi:hypothetical protein